MSEVLQVLSALLGLTAEATVLDYIIKQILRHQTHWQYFQSNNKQ